ncbi:hypothetical protein [Myxococcus sp. AB036A]|uniref:hypothetical protein n=1 Tax=Myxococcus sp. AB036A TaxID=2562793 RepID=UPI0011468D6B|nr:hypothetical protein [Myxococcus sp. AB036A]
MKSMTFIRTPAALIVVLGAPTALAQGAAAPEPTLTSILMSTAVQVVPIVATALAALLVAGLTGLTNKLKAQAEVSKLAAVGERSATVALSVVRHVDVTMKPRLEAAAADGVLTQEEFQQLKAEAMTRLKESLGGHGLRELQEVLKLAPGKLGEFLSGLIEDALDRMKASRGIVTTTAEDVISAALALGAASTASPTLERAAFPQTPRG